jgi:hypothetical protein
LVAIVAIGALVTGGSVFAAPSTDASVGEYSQCANDKPPATTTACPQNWINGILNANNSGYHEDENTAQRLILDLPRNGPTTNRKIFVKYLARKGQGGVGNHAYDSLGQWNYTQTTADRCQGVTGTCPGGSESKFTIPVDNTVVRDSNGAGSSTALHELPDANRYMSMFGGTITNISAPVHDNASGSGDDFAQVTVTYSVTSTPTRVELLFGGHLAPAVGPRGWGAGVGASFINGGPYHIKLVQVDNSSVGNRDNQITAGAILPIGTEVQTALHQTDSSGVDVSPANNQDPVSQSGITVTLPSNGNGVYVTDYATVVPATATGTVGFRYYSTEAACTADTAFTGGVSAGSGKSLDSNGVAKSDAKLITAAGVYYWRAHFTGTNLSVDSDSGCTREVLTANQATSTSTTLHQTDANGVDLASPNNAASITVPVGAYVKDYASIVPAGVNSGTVTFRYYATQAACSADSDGTGGSSGGSGIVSSGSASGSTVQFTSSGTFYWRAFYSGDANNDINASSSACGDEVLTVQKASATIASDPRLIPQDHATIAGILAGGSTQATITFSLWGPNNASCDPSDASHPALYSEQQNVNGTGTQTFTTNNSGNPAGNPAGFRLTSASAHGVYHWSADYSGDEANNPNNRDCVEAFDFEGITDAAAG